jgi:hypothetical protein
MSFCHMDARRAAGTVLQLLKNELTLFRIAVVALGVSLILALNQT